MVKAAVFAVPGNLATPTGGYAYDRRMIAELGLLGWHMDVLDLGDGYPRPSAATRAGALARLSALTPGRPVVIDGLAFGVLPEGAQALRARHALIALVHHPLALESGLTTGQADALRASERSALACARHVVATSATTARLLAADYGVASERVSVVEPGTDRVTVAPRRQAAEVALLAVGAVVPRKGYDVLICALAIARGSVLAARHRGRLHAHPTTSRQLESDIVRLGLSGRITMRGAVSSGGAELALCVLRSVRAALALRRLWHGIMPKPSPMACRWSQRRRVRSRRRCRPMPACWCRPMTPKHLRRSCAC